MRVLPPILKAHISIPIKHLRLIEVSLVGVNHRHASVTSSVVRERNRSVVRLLFFKAESSFALFIVHHEPLVVAVFIIVSDVRCVISLNEILRRCQQRCLSVVVALNVAQLRKQIACRLAVVVVDHFLALVQIWNRRVLHCHGVGRYCICLQECVFSHASAVLFRVAFIYQIAHWVHLHARWSVHVRQPVFHQSWADAWWNN